MPAEGRRSFASRILRSRETGIVMALAIMVIGLGIFAPDFATPDNMLNDARNFSFVGIVVLGQAMVMITGGIDLSVGSVWGLTAVASAAMMNAGMGTIPACVLALLIAALFGLFNGLCVTKLDNPQSILDIGTGTGIWAIEMGDLYPSAQIIGTDLSPIQPQWVPPNVQFEVDDAELEWLYPKASFDMIHARSLGGSLRDWPKFLERSFE